MTYDFFKNLYKSTAYGVVFLQQGLVFCRGTCIMVYVELIKKARKL
jgi:hypothetical protein